MKLSSFFSVMLCIIASSTLLKAQSPNISVTTPQSFIQGTAITPIQIQNSGGAVPKQIYSYTSTRAIANPGSPFYGIGSLSLAMAIDKSGVIYFTNDGLKIAKIDKTGFFSIVAGDSFGNVDGTGPNAKFKSIVGIAINKDGNLYVTENDPGDGNNSRIRKVTPQGVVTTIKRDLGTPGPITVDANDNIYFVELQRVMKITPQGVKTDVTGNWTNFSVKHLAADSKGNVYAVDGYVFNRVFQIKPDGSSIIFRGQGSGYPGFYPYPIIGADVDAKDNLYLLVGDQVVKIDPQGGETVLSGVYNAAERDGPGSVAAFPYASNIVASSVGDVYVIASGQKIRAIKTEGYDVRPALPAGMVLSETGLISGTPTVVIPATDYVVTAINNSGTSTTTLRLSIAIPPTLPVITDFSPKATVKDRTVTISGKNLSGITNLKVGTASVPFTLVAEDQLTFVVPANLASGVISVTNPYGTATGGVFTTATAPIITNITPTRAYVGEKVTIAGAELLGTTDLYVGGYRATFTIKSNTEIETTVPENARAEGISVFTPAGSTYNTSFAAIQPPSITATTTQGGRGSVITIDGGSFTDVTSVNIGGVPATSFTIVNSTRITAIAAADATGNKIVVSSPAGTAEKSGFTFIPAPTITSFTPTKVGNFSNGSQTITIVGTNLSNITSLSFGGIPCTNFYGLGTSIQAYPTNAASGDIVVKTVGGTVTMPGFIMVSAPSITSITPATFSAGSTVTVKGTNLDDTRSVVFGQSAAKFTQVSTTELTAIVPEIVTNLLTVYALGGVTSSSNFVHEGPNVTSFLPRSASTGTTVTITGTKFDNLTEVKFGNIPATSFQLLSPTQISAVVGSGQTGSISIKTDKGTGTISGFSHSGPYITNFTNTGIVGSTILINGGNFSGATSVKFGGLSAKSFEVVSSTVITAVIDRVNSGDIEINTPLGTAKIPGFIFADQPTITSFTPTSAGPGATIVVTGTNFVGVSAVTIGGVRVAAFYASSSTMLNINLDGALGRVSGDIVVTTVAGKASIPGFTYTGIMLTDFLPKSAATGEPVTIKGENFSGVTSVQFGFTPATSFTVISPTEIRATVGQVASGSANVSVTVSSALSTSALSGLNYFPPPTAYGLYPQIGGKGSVIAISGNNLQYVTGVTVGGTPVKSFTITPNGLSVILDSHQSGSVTITTSGGTASISGFTWVAAPTITAFSPDHAAAGSTVTITGTNLANVTSVKFGTISGSITTSTETELKVVVPTCESGPVIVSGIGGEAQKTGFTFIPKAVITGYAWTGVPHQSTIKLTGSNFVNVSAVWFDGFPSTAFTVVSPTEITVLPVPGKTGRLSVLNDGGTGIFDSFVYNEIPKISSISPRTGPAETVITITGSNFNATAEKNAVYFGSIKSRVIAGTNTSLQVAVPAAGTFQPIRVIDTETHLTGNSPTTFAVVHPGWTTNLKPNFVNKAVIKLDGYLLGQQIYDVDGDGQNDLVVLTSNQLVVYRSKRAGLITDDYFEKVIVQNRQVRSFAAGDLTGDGLVDFSFANSSGILVMKNTSVPGKVSFQAQFIDDVYTQTVPSMRIADYDLDGKADLIDVTSMAIYRNTSDLLGDAVTLAPKVSFFDNRDGGAGLSILADMNSDGKVDGLLNRLGARIELSKNTSVPGVASYKDNGSIYLNSGLKALLVTDLNNDDKPDILMSRTPGYDNDDVSYMLNTSSNGDLTPASFSSPEYITRTGAITSVSLVDLNGDGQLDFTVASDKRVSAAVRSTIQVDGWVSALGGFAQSNLEYSGVGGSINNVILGDLNTDGRPELIISSASENMISIYHNGFNITPTIASFAPTKAAQGDTIRITGTNFIKPSVVTFGGQPAQSFQLISATQINAVVGKGATGEVAVTTIAGDVNKDGFLFIPAPIITDINPKFALLGSKITIKGKNFTDASQVKFGTADIKTFTVVDAETISATIAQTGTAAITVTTPGGTSVLDGLTMIPTPVINASGPTELLSGATVVLSANTGSSFTYAWYKNDVEISGETQASVTVSSVGSYRVSIVVPGLNAPSNTIAISILAPLITDFTPRYTTVGSTVTIQGSNFTGATKVKLGGSDATSFTIVNKETITAVTSVVGNGSVSVTTPGGTATLTGLTVLPIPKIVAEGSTKFGTGGSVVLSANTGPDFTYAWYLNSVEIPAETKESLKATQTGTYKVSIVVPGLKVPSNEIAVTAIFGLPANNFKLQIGAAACKGSDNGSVKITAASTNSYIATVDGDQRNSVLNFSDGLTVSDLKAGTYAVCITVAGQPDYKQCFEVVIEEPKDLQLYSSISKDNRTVTLSLSGSDHYFVNINGKVYETNQQELVLPIQTGKNEITVSSDKVCQTKISKTVQVFGKLIAFPNPFENNISVSTGDMIPVQIEIRDLTGKLVYTGKHRNESGMIQLALQDLNAGIYSMKIITEKTESYLKIIKK